MSILIIQTGGTIDKIYPKSIQGWGFEIGDAAVVKILSNKTYQLMMQIVSACKKDSTTLNENDLNHILDICQNQMKNKLSLLTAQIQYWIQQNTFLLLRIKPLY